MLSNGAVLHLIFLISLITGQKETGSPCNLTSTGQEGECVLLEECPHAVEDLKNRRFPQICGFQGPKSIICCLKNISPTSTFPSAAVTTETITSTNSQVGGVISKQKCRQYSKHPFVNRAPVLIADVDEYMRNVCDFRINLENGTRTTARANEFPHMALVGFMSPDDKILWLCGGSLVSEQYVLTAAHCLETREYGPSKYVKVGITNRLKDTRHLQQRKITELISHPEYKHPSKYNDIGLLKLEKPIEITPYAAPACLHTEYNINTNWAVATGWGKTDFAGDLDDNLHKVVVKFTSAERCNQTYGITRQLKKGITDVNMLCAITNFNAMDTCQGDSGGPLQTYHTGDDVECMYDIVGIVSFSKSCGIANIPGVYTRVSNYVKWIEDVVWS